MEDLYISTGNVKNIFIVCVVGFFWDFIRRRAADLMYVFVIIIKY